MAEFPQCNLPGSVRGQQPERHAAGANVAARGRPHGRCAPEAQRQQQPSSRHVVRSLGDARVGQLQRAARHQRRAQRSSPAAL